MFVDELTDVIFTTELGSEPPSYLARCLEPQFVGFQCFGCGERHPDLAGLLDCQERLRQFYARQDYTFVPAKTQVMAW